MRSKASLFLMEQLIMVLVFALAAALCLQVFVRAEEISLESARRDEAVIVARNAAELVCECQVSVRVYGIGTGRHDGDSRQSVFDCSSMCADVGTQCQTADYERFLLGFCEASNYFRTPFLAVWRYVSGSYHGNVLRPGPQVLRPGGALDI